MAMLDYVSQNQRVNMVFFQFPTFKNGSFVGSLQMAISKKHRHDSLGIPPKGSTFSTSSPQNMNHLLVMVIWTIYVDYFLLWSTFSLILLLMVIFHL